MIFLIKAITEASTLIQATLFVLIFTTLWTLENVSGILKSYRKWSHALMNSLFVLTAVPVQAMFSYAFASVIHWTTMHHFGVVQWLTASAPLWVVFAIALVLLDLSEYVYHRFMHGLPPLWKLHLVHHSDRIVDVSTVLREHPLETFVRLTSTLFWTFLFGVPAWCLIFRQILQIWFTIYTHANVRLPERLDHAISLILVTPNMHQVHHHYRLPLTDMNYGDILSIWDHLFGTFQREKAENLVFGVDTHFEKVERADGLALIKLPFVE